MEKTIETVRTNFNSIRTGRANPAMLDRVEVCIIYLRSISSAFQLYPFCLRLSIFLHKDSIIKVLNEDASLASGSWSVS